MHHAYMVRKDEEKRRDTGGDFARKICPNARHAVQSWPRSSEHYAPHASNAQVHASSSDRSGTCRSLHPRWLYSRRCDAETCLREGQRSSRSCLRITRSRLGGPGSSSISAIAVRSVLNRSREGLKLIRETPTGFRMQLRVMMAGVTDLPQYNLTVVVSHLLGPFRMPQASRVSARIMLTCSPFIRLDGSHGLACRRLSRSSRLVQEWGLLCSSRRA